ncbi:hypothetical protein ACFQ9J_21105 [Streptomyces sp. NPDC056529]|uniref:hypothetical protein n=1 Tax=Streptomyces sp. NPDC056529 TaxID=3345855 RepID=UPI003676AEB2
MGSGDIPFFGYQLISAPLQANDNRVAAPVVFQDADFKGASAVLQEGSYNRVPGDVGDNAISSIKVPLGWKVTVFADYDLKGASREYTTGSGWLADFNDTISSLKVERI